MSCKRFHSELHESEAHQHFKLRKHCIISSVFASAAVHPLISYESAARSTSPQNISASSDLNTNQRDLCCIVFSDGSEQIFPGLKLSTLLSVAPGSVQQEGLNLNEYSFNSEHPISIKIHTSLMARDFHAIMEYADRGMNGFENKTLHDAVSILLAFEKVRGEASFLSPLFRWIAHYIWTHSILYGLSNNQIISSWPLTELTESSRWSICAILNGCSR
jgi:hypothetical protein